MTSTVTGLRNVEISVLIKMLRTISLLLTLLLHFRSRRLKVSSSEMESLNCLHLEDEPVDVLHMKGITVESWTVIYGPHAFDWLIRNR
jgi:hypothetical protein